MARSEKVEVTLTGIEKREIERAAKKSEKSLASFVRESAIEMAKKVKK